METSMLLVVGFVMIAVAYIAGKGRSLSVAKGIGGAKNLNSLPFYYGTLTALWCGIPSFVLLAIWGIFDNYFITQIVIQEMSEQVQNLSKVELGLLMNTVANIAENNTLGLSNEPHVLQAAERLRGLQHTNQLAMTGAFISAGIILMMAGWLRVKSTLPARVHVEKVFKWVLLGCACIAIFTTIGIVFSVLFESIRFFKSVPIADFLFGLDWSPQMAIRTDQVGGSGAFGAVPLFMGTMLISMIAMLVAVPAGLMAAIYLAEYAHPKIRSAVKPMLEVLAGVPTVVYGFFAALTVAPFLRDSGAIIGLSVSSESALAAGLVMGVMIIPFVSSLSDDVITAVPQSLRDGSLGLGATQSETIKKVVIPAALPGIVGGVLLAVSRAIGETMIVVMAAGLAAHLTMNPLDSVTTVTVQIVKILVGDQEFNSPKTLAAFALGLMLFTVTLALNFIALQVVKKYREQYD